MDAEDQQDMYSLTVQLLVLQALQPLHAQGRGHCDIKMQNIRVELGDDGSILSCIVVDLGASAVFQGKP